MVDGGSRDSTRDIARDFIARVDHLQVLISDRGIGHQRNVGARAARYENLIFLDADVVVPRNFLDKLGRKIPQDERLVAWMLNLPLHGNLLDYVFVIIAYIGIVLLRPLGPVTGGASLFTTKKHHQSIGGFREGALMGEDLDYGFRSVRSGARYRFFFNPYVRTSTRRAGEMGRSRLLYTWVRSFFHMLFHEMIACNIHINNTDSGNMT